MRLVEFSVTVLGQLSVPDSQIKLPNKPAGPATIA